MYNNYYSSADAQIYFFSVDSQKFIKVDTTIAIAYNLTQTSTPIYSLGCRTARYFSVGNTVCNGVLAIAFSDEEYIKYCINYLSSDLQPNIAISATNTAAQALATAPPMDDYSSTASSKAIIGQLSNTDFAALDRSAAVSAGQRIISIGSIGELFDIKIFLNNESVFRASDSKVITLKAVKLVGDSMEINSSSDSFLSTGYKFIFKDIIRE